jgi:glycolate oxidase iron-sulfur subunit
MAPLRAAQRLGLDRALERSGLADRLPGELGAALRLAPPPSRARGPRAGAPALPDRVPARGTRRATVGMLTGCVQRVFFPDVNAATARVLAAEGCDVVIPAGQGCCGALSLHGGRREEAARLARQAIETFERAGVDAIVVNVAGCGSAMKEYADLLEGDQQWARRAAALAGKVRDFSEFLTELGPAAPRHPLPLTVAYHDACHLAHAQPRQLLSAIPQLRLAEIADAGTCCGSAGIYNLVQPGPARDLGRRKADAVAATQADLLVSGNPGCAMQISSALAERGTRLPMLHIAEVLDASIRGEGAGSLLA